MLRHLGKFVGLAWALCATAVAAQGVSADFQRLDIAGLPNAIRLHERVISGGEPASEAAFGALARLGVKTIISVDGARPDIEAAARFGLRYVHLPHGYDGIPQSRAKELGRAVRDLPGPIYIHCHHGKHRSPAAAAAACVVAGLIPHEQAIGVLRTAGTSEHYRGLYQSADSARRVDDAALDAAASDFPATARIPPIADAMVQIEHAHDHLRSLADNDWRPLAGHPDLVAAHEALLLKEAYRELARTPDAQKQSAEFRRRLSEAEQRAEQLEAAARDWESSGRLAAAPPGLRRSFQIATEQCAGCHQRFRDVPLGEKRQ